MYLPIMWIPSIQSQLYKIFLRCYLQEVGRVDFSTTRIFIVVSNPRGDFKYFRFYWRTSMFCVPSHSKGRKIFSFFDMLLRFESCIIINYSFAKNYTTLILIFTLDVLTFISFSIDWPLSS